MSAVDLDFLKSLVVLVFRTFVWGLAFLSALGLAVKAFGLLIAYLTETYA